MAPTIEQFLDNYLKADEQLFEYVCGTLVSKADNEYKRFKELIPEDKMDVLHEMPLALALEKLKTKGIMYEIPWSGETMAWGCEHIVLLKNREKGDLVHLGVTLDAETFEEVFPRLFNQVDFTVSEKSFDEDWNPDNGFVQYDGTKYIVDLDITNTSLGYDLRITEVGKTMALAAQACGEQSSLDDENGD